MAYRHGVYVSEEATSVLPPVNVNAGLPVVFGTAPVHLTDDPAATVNKPILVYSYSEAVAALGYVPADESTGKFAFTLSEYIRSQFALFATAPVVLVNVLDPATHKTSITAESVTLVDDQAALAEIGALRSTIVVKDTGGSTTYVLDTDYVITYNDAGAAVINRVATGSISAGATLEVDYDHLDPSAVTDNDIIGGIDGITGDKTGLELVNEVFPRFRLVPGQIVVPGFSGTSEVAAVMDAKAVSINGHFRAISLVDIPTDTVKLYTDAPSWKNSNNVVMPNQVACWPMVALGDSHYHLSSQLAPLNCLSDSQNGDIPYRSPSNQNLKMDSSLLADGSEVFLGPDQGAYLNGQGIITALNFTGGWRAWGNRTACYPANTDPKDAFLALRRMFNWVGNTLILTFWQRLDYPLNRRQIQTIVDSANIWLNGLVAQQYLLGARVEFREDENPVTDLMDGIARFHVYMTPPSPNREIDFIQEYDPQYLESLF